ncbi:MAG: exodeoxyribonuclease V subunit gamma, partial [Candidatus Eisenbacteria bacterium]|nr:exodeoxyribonuclease V subunit gamma [Candidatus Eisenbacteria bacterium]
MAVRFLLGVAGSGKTHHCLAGLRTAEAEARVAIYIVPEQFTYSADRELLEGSDLPGLRHTRVLSFSRLATWLEERSDQASPPTLDPAVRPMVLRAALARLDPVALGPLAPFRHRPGFLDELARFVSEIRNHGMVDFLAALERGERAEIALGVRAKLRALGRAFDAYQELLRELRREDPEERLARLPGLIALQAAELRGVSIWVDGFLSWTRRERDALVALALAGANLEIALCLDPTEALPRAPFLPIARSRRLLEAVLRNSGLEPAPPLVFPARPRFRAPGLAALEANLLSEQPRPAEASEVTLLTAADRRQEVQLWARAIDRWLRVDAPAAAPREIAVLVRDIEPYREAVHEIFPRYRIPYFLDERRSVIAHPRVRFLIGAFEVILSGWKRASVISWLRSPLLGNAPATIDLLENLSLAAGHNFEAWHAPEWPDAPLLPRERRWRVSAPEEALPTASEAESEESEVEADATDLLEVEVEEPGPEQGGDIGLVEPSRRRCLLPLRALELAWGSGLSGPEAQGALRTHLGPLVRPITGEDPAWEARVEEALEKLIEEAALIWREVPVSLDDFARTLREGLRALRLGVTPVRLDEVSVGDVRRSRLQGIRHAIVGGLTDGAFPRAVPDGPVVNELDRAALAALGAPLGPTAREQQEEETYLFYIALTRCSDQLVLTYATSDALGGPLGPSLLLSEVERALPTLAPVPPPLLVENGPVAAVQTLPELEATLTRLAVQDDVREPLLDLLRTVPDGGQPAPGSSGDPWDDLRARLERRVADGEFERRVVSTHLEADVQEVLYGGNELLSSVSRLESYARCPYQHFAGSVLKLAPRIVAEVSAIETGLLAHAALELFFKQETLVPRAEVPTALAAVFRRLETRPDLRAFQVDQAARHRWTSTERSLARFLDLEL